ncbi:MAG: sigma-70 family RNA polymerase sigma factor [Alphaproteobacteria bacterium]|jgi:RNA polymerase sigma-70 factor (ECF subfamily)|nr:sigma-70 family RNA polymerase sigma factor [Alphaproteobacteria bacterium]
MRKGSSSYNQSHGYLNPNVWTDLYADYLYGFALVRINNIELAKDLVQETFLSALERVDSFQGLCSEKTWLTAILKNKIVDVYRKKPLELRGLLRSTVAEYQDFFDAEEGRWVVQHSPVGNWEEQPDALQNKEFQGIFKACMAKLPPLWSSVFTMKHVNDESSETIIKDLNLSSSNYWVIIHRAKVNLRSCLQRNWI